MRFLFEPGNGESHDSKGETSDEGEENKGESPRSESIAVTAMDSSENGKEKPAKVTENPPEEEKEKEKVVVEETVAITVSREAEDVSVELFQSEKEEVGGGGGSEGSTEVAEVKSAASVVPVHEPVSVTEEEVIDTTEAAAVTSEALAQESEVKPVPISITPPAPVIERSQPLESGELCHESERSEVTIEMLKQVCRIDCFYCASFMLHY